MTIENFKGIKRLEVAMGGVNTEIIAENGVGKTTVYDAFLWALFGKDSTGRSDFGIRPLDRFNNVIKGLVTVVEAVIQADGDTHIFRKELHEKIVKKQLKGYTSVCSVDGVPKLQKEYNAFVDALVTEERFKLLTDVNYFCGILHWADRRKVLLELAGETEKPQGYSELLANAGNLSLGDYKKKITDEKKGYAKEREGINPRIDELLRGLEQPEGGLESIENQRKRIESDISTLKMNFGTFLKSEKKRQELINRKNLLSVELNKRELDLLNDPARTKALADEKAEITAKLSGMGNAIIEHEGKLKNAQAEKDTLTNQRKLKQTALEDIRKEYTLVETEPSPDTCYACKQALPEAMKEKVEADRKAKLVEITAMGNEVNTQVEGLTAEIEKVETSIIELQKAVAKSKASLEDERITAHQRFEEIDRAIKDLPPIEPEGDEVYFKLQLELNDVEAEIGEPVTEQLEQIDSELTKAQGELKDVNDLLAQADRMAKDRARVQELTAREKELAQLIADIDKMLCDIRDYKRAEAEIITEKVNGLFRHVTFKMFEQRLSEDAEDKPMCEAVYKGVPYAEMSFGQRIFCGVDIINTLSEYYGVSVPMFLDHAESITLPIETKAQTIELRAVEGVKQLQVQTKISQIERQVA
jgi:DNA repair exonuclease SbcCD ATPase subunit